MAPIEGGRFRMGSDDYYPEERPSRLVAVARFWMDLHPVTNAQFARFVAATGYATGAERLGRSLVFTPPPGPVDLGDPRHWWTDRPSADWRHPHGPGSAADPDHPVVHVSWLDAQAYCRWAQARLPREAGGLEGAPFAWGDELVPGGSHMANIWQGEFPWHNARDDGYAGTSPVCAYPPNGFGLYDMIGNVWEWTADDFGTVADSCCGNNAGPHTETLKTIKGGSYLCAPNYCQRYRPAARSAHAAASATGHVGFRCVRDLT
jgi:formylglycine-generating enzyme required for sulfatase activity